MYFLWIDPWIRKLWYWLIDESLNVIDGWILLSELKKNERIESFERIKQIYDFFDELTDKYKIKNVWIEKLFFTEYNQANAEFVYWVRWALVMLFLSKWIKIFEYTPIELKKSITWNWKAEKILVQQFIKRIFWLKDLPEFNDTADALGFAYLVSKK